ncbi:uncharacterized protein NECHADRAFT_80854 [Fusarium vanettenii 77-13-4]|uniref:Mid2 domain-containing protein n=1 Tax=Fusarium vanettenii (strain ATCC MYA-4622 / CBS 123669 / FGSC 9596 / NRRL 45880 / 77-13-4) TaxID=660122 RepID=C7YSU4_FUSV7|nr:uncharacterized protein NECHADRAFT_80854 [Fusarium vanettenii 77-13-4]EEU45298.1 predicted protein [Fusarium vanettenii 77-13-4]
MDRWCRIVPFMVLAFQSLIATTTAQNPIPPTAAPASDGEVIGYAKDGSTSMMRKRLGSATPTEKDITKFTHHAVEAPFTTPGEKPTDWSVPSATSTDDSDDTRSSGIERGGPSPGVIAGAVVGALAGIALIACALIIGFRMGRRHPQLDNQESGSKKSFRNTISSFPRPAIARSRPNDNGTPERDLQNDVSVLQVNFSDDATAKRASKLPSPAQSPVSQVQSIPPPISPQPYSTTAAESHRVELPTGIESQGWARSDAHPLPYEVDAQPQAHEVDGAPNTRASSP